MDTKVVGRDVSLEGATLIAASMEGLEVAPGSEGAWDHLEDGLLDALGFEGKKGQATTFLSPLGGTEMELNPVGMSPPSTGVYSSARICSA